MERMNVLDSWLRVDNCLAPLQQKQLNFIDKLESINKISEQQANDRKSVETDNKLSYNLSDLDTIEDSINRNKDYRYLKLINYHSYSKELVDLVTNSLELLSQLEQQYLFVSNKTKALHNSCEVLLQQQNGLIVAVDTINEKLTYFKQLEQISKKLSSPTMLVLNESLMPMLARLDECIDYMISKPNYKESSQYLKQYKHLQSQALFTIKTHVINSLQQTSQQVMPESKDALSPNDSVFTLFYGKFQSNAHRIKTLMHQIEERVSQSELYSEYLSECHLCFFNIRNNLIRPVLSMAIDEMVNSYKRNFCALIRSSSTLLIHICQDEYHLYFQFFTKPSNHMNAFLEKLCQLLYDVLLPIVIRLEHLESLSEICYILKNEMIEENLVSHSLELEPFIKLMQQLLEDTQERLVYRCNIYIQTNIIGYMAAPGDLAYPEKLEMMKTIAENINASKVTESQLSRSNSVCSVVSTSLSDISLVTTEKSYDVTKKQHQNRSPADLHGMWYPTVRRTLMCLTKLYHSLDKPTFQGLSQEVLTACIKSLEMAQNQISKKKSALDGQLFLIKHLLIIREQIAPFHIEITLKEYALDFTRTKAAAVDLLHKRENLFSLSANNSFLKFFFDSSPQVTEIVIESQKAVDNKIKSTCESFILHSSNLILADFIKLLNSSKTLENANNLKANDSFKPEALKQSIIESNEAFKTNLTLVQNSMALYLANKDTEAILFRPIKAKIEAKIDELRKFVNSNYSDNERQIISLQSIIELNL